VLDYDIIVLGLGVVTNYFGIPGMEDFSYGIKSFDAIRRFKEHLHNQIEDERRPDLNYVIVGAGPTGIELAGALPEYLRKVMEIHGVKHKAVYIDLIEAAPRLLPRMPPSTSLRVASRLRRKGVKLFTDSAVQGVAADQLIVSAIRSRATPSYGPPVSPTSVLQKQWIHGYPARQSRYQPLPRG
jgi:NADH dehydrogenase